MPSFIAQLKAALPEADWPVVVAALRTHPAVWGALQDESFGHAALEAAGSDSRTWSPAFLGLLSLGQPHLFAPLQADSRQPVDEKLRYQAAAAYESLSLEGSDTQAENSDLAQAALLALALRERNRLQKGWGQLVADLSLAPAGFWSLPLACLLGFLSDPADMLVALFGGSQDPDLQKAGLAALLSNPLPAEEQVALLNRIATQLELPAILNLLRSLAAHRSPLAQSLAQQALTALPESPTPRGDQLDQLHKMLLQSEIHQLSGQPEQALPLLNAAWEAAQNFQATLADKLAEAAGPDGAAASLDPDWLEENEAARAGGRRKQPAALISAARVAIKSADFSEAGSMAAAALEALQHNPQLDPASLPGLAELFLDLGQPAKAKDAAQLSCQVCPNDGHSAHLLSRAGAALGDESGTLEAAHLATALQPDNLELRRDLARRLGAADSHQEALREWEAIVAHKDDAGEDDWLALAACALDCGAPQRGIEACQHLIEQDGEHGLAHALMGRALMLSGDTTSAVDYLRRATQLAPAEAEPWLALAAYQRQRGEADQALETLLNAGESVPASARIQAALAEVYETLEQKAKALATYRHAHELAALKPAAGSALIEDLSLHIGLLQVELGRAADARAALARAHQAYPANPHIARHYAHLLLDAGEAAPALSALAIARQVLPDDPDIQLDTARAQLALDKDLEQSQAILEHILKRQPDHWQARALLAETHQALGQPEKALKGFAGLVKSIPAEEPAWAGRLALGKAAAELALDQVDDAISTLETLSKTTEADLELQRALCSAYQRAGRADEAFQIARQVYLSSAKDGASLLWYAEQAAALGKPAEAIEELSKAAEGGAEITLHLAELQWTAGDQSAALESFARLLKSKHADCAYLQRAAGFLGEQGAVSSSLPYWQRAVEVAETPDFELFLAYGRAQAHSGELDGALASLEAAIELAPNSPDLLAEKAEIQQELGRPQAALLSLDQALAMLPEDAGLLTRKARLLHASGDWGAALEAAERALENDAPEEGVLEFAVDLAAACLQPERARALLANTPELGAELACLDAELALDLDQELQAAQALAPALEADEDAFRVQALQARLAARRGDRSAAEGHFHAALKAFSAIPDEEQASPRLIAVALAALELQDWETAIKLLQQAVEGHPEGARGQFALGKALLLRAERAQLCRAADALLHAPRVAALDAASADAAFAAFENVLHGAPFPAPQALIARWAARARLRFGAELDLSDLPSGYPATSGEAATLSYAAGRKDATQNIDDLITDFSTAPQVQIELALYAAAHDPEGAYTLAASAVHQDPGTPPYHALAARFANAVGEPEDALAHINQALSLWPNEPRWHAFAAELHQAADRLPEAAHHLEQAVALEDQHAVHHAALGEVLLQSGQFEAAVKSLAQARDLDGQDAITLLGLAEAHRGAGDLAQARVCAGRAAKLSAGPDVAAVLLQGELALQEGQADQAEKYAEQALKRKPRDGAALRLYAEALAALGSIEDAIDVLERAMQAAADPVPLQIRRAQILPAGRAESSLDALIRLSQRHPERADVFQALSQALALAGEFDDALQAAQHAVKHSDQLDKAAAAGLRLHYAQLLKYFGQLDQALHQLDEALKLASHLVDVHLERGQVFLARRQFEQAMGAFAEASRVAPRDAEPHLQAGLVLKEAKDYSAAEAELRRAAELAPKDPRIQRQLAGLIALNLVHQPDKIGVS